MIIPNIWENKKYSKPPTSCNLMRLMSHPVSLHVSDHLWSLWSVSSVASGKSSGKANGLESLRPAIHRDVSHELKPSWSPMTFQWHFNDIPMTFQWHFPPSLSSPTCFFSVPNPFCPCPARCFVSSESWPVPLLSAGSASPTPPAEVQRQTAAVARLPPPTPQIPAGSAAAPSAAGPTPPGGAVGSPAPSRPSPVPSLWHRRPGRCWESSGPLPPSNLSRPRRRERLGTSQALASQSPLGIPGKMGFQPEQQGALYGISPWNPHIHITIFLYLPEVPAISEPSGTASWVVPRVSLAPSAVPCPHVAPAAVQRARNWGQVSLGSCCQETPS